MTTRRAWREQQAQEKFASNNPINSFTDSAATTPSSSDSTLVVVSKRKELHDPSPAKPKKKSRSPPIIQVTKPHEQRVKYKKREVSSIPPSRQSSRPPRTLASSPEPEHSASRSRSVSSFPPVDAPILRPCGIDDDGKPGPGFLSNEDVVWKLMENDRTYYKGCMSSFVFSGGFDINPSCFSAQSLRIWMILATNPLNLNRTLLWTSSFLIIMRLSGGCIHWACAAMAYGSHRYLLLAPKDPDHYHPVFCLEASLYVIVESASRSLDIHPLC